MEARMQLDLSYTELLVLVDALKQSKKEELVSEAQLKALEEKLIRVMNGYSQWYWGGDR
jgi:hypothetical protein